jgi:hypothetical protein
MSFESQKQKEIAYFRRLTWYLAKKTGLGADMEIIWEDDEGEEQDKMMVPGGELTEEEDVCLSEGTELENKDLWLFETLAILPTRTNKVVTVALGSMGAIYHEEPDDETITFTRNPRRSVDTVSAKDSTAHWISNYGLRLTDVKSSKKDSKLSPGRPLVDHISYLIEYMRQVHTASPENKGFFLCGLHGYVLRSSFPKIHARIGYHSRDLRPPNPQKSKKKEKMPTDFVEYSTIIMPMKMTKTSKLAKLFDGNEELDTRQREIIIKYIGYQKEPRQLPEQYRYDIRCTDFERGVLVWLSSTFDLPSINEDDPTSVHEYIGTLILGFITGVHTIAASTYLYNKENPSAIMMMLESTSWSEVEYGLRNGVQSLVYLAVGLSGMLSGTFLSRHLEHVCKSEQTKGYLRWLKLITEHFAAVSTLTSDRYIGRIVKAKVCVLEVFLHGSHTDMTSLEDSLDRIQFNPHPDEGDRKRLLEFLKKIPYGDSFGGTTHCEVVIFLLVYIAKSPQYAGSFPEDLMDHFRAINTSRLGISKRCCPLCAALLRIIGRRLGTEVETCGVHATVSPCSLPPWTPPEIIQEIITELETQVRPLLLQKAKQLRPAFKTDRGSATPPEQHAQPPATFFAFEMGDLPLV